MNSFIYKWDYTVILYLFKNKSVFVFFYKKNQEYNVNSKILVKKKNFFSEIETILELFDNIKLIFSITFIIFKFNENTCLNKLYKSFKYGMTISD